MVSISPHNFSPQIDNEMYLRDNDTEAQPSLNSDISWACMGSCGCVPLVNSNSRLDVHLLSSRYCAGVASVTSCVVVVEDAFLAGLLTN